MDGQTNTAIRFLLVLAWPAIAWQAYGFDVAALAVEDPTADYFFVAAILLFLTIVLGLWSGGGVSALSRATRGPHAENLFLNVSLQGQPPGSTAIKAYLRRVDLNSATIVSHQFFPKGSQVSLQLSSLPQFSGQSDLVSAKVIHSQVVRGDPPSYIMTLSWRELPKHSHQELATYIANLSGEHHLSPG